MKSYKINNMSYSNISKHYIVFSGHKSGNTLEKIISELQNIAGIVEIEPDHNLNRLYFQSDEKKNIIPLLFEKLRSSGLEPITEKSNFPLLNMSCASCAASSQSILEQSFGIVSASVNFADNSAKIEYVPSLTNPEKLKTALQNAGFELITEVNEAEQEIIEERYEKNLTSLKSRVLMAVLLSMPVMIIGMFFENIPYANYIMWVLSTPVVFWFGRDFFINAYKQFKLRRANMDTLVALSTGTAYVFSVFNIVFDDFWLRRGLDAHVYFEAAAVIIAFILIGRLLEERAKGKTSDALKKLIGMQAKTVHIVDADENIREIPVDQIKKGDIIQVRPGEKIAVDGIIVSGTSFLDESMISGEPIPVEKSANSRVFSGSVNQKGSFRFIAERIGRETLLAQIIQMVRDAQGSKAKIQKLVDKIAGVFVPVVILIALLSFVVWSFSGIDNAFSYSLLAFVTVLVIACPCALGLATPTAIMVGIGKGAESGILIKDADSLQLAGKIDAVVLDKTGTITVGKPEVNEIFWKKDDQNLKKILFAIENRSEHPLAEAILKTMPDMDKIGIDSFESITGAGVKAVLNDKTYYVGNKSLLVKNEINIPEEIADLTERWQEEAKTLVLFSDDSEVLAAFAISDTIKPTSIAAINKLKKDGIEVHMLTGDNESSARAIASQAGIENYKAGLLPQDKQEYVKELQAKGLKVAMTGDGINDSNALAQADVGIAMGRGSDIAKDVAGIVIVSSDLMKIPMAFRLSRLTVNTIRQNLFWAFIYNVIGIPVAAGILYPVNGFLLNPMIAGAAMALSSVSVVTNSLRLKYRKL